MAIVVQMPKLSDTMTEGVVANWNVKEGDIVKSGDVIAEVETDKATMDVEVFDGGTILKLMVDEGSAVPLGGTMAIIGKPGEDISALLGGNAPASTPAKETKPETTSDSPAKTETPAPVQASTESDGRIKASPLARKMAADKDIDLRQVSGSGPEGRIIKADIENFKSVAVSVQSVSSSTPAVMANQHATYTEVRVSQMRKTIAKRLAESKFTSPHFYETIDIDMKKAIELRGKINEISDVKISFNDFVVKAAAVALMKHPKINSSWLEDTIRTYQSAQVAVAVAIEDGLVTPVIRDAQSKTLSQISKETKDLATRARDRKLDPSEWEGSTFSISNLGMYGIEEFTAIINPPNACILAVGAIRDVPVIENGEVVPGKRMKVTLSSDHRVVDGASSAEFLQTFKNLLENPMGILI